MFKDLYKQTSAITADGVPRQEIRRQEALSKQRAKRAEAIDENRPLPTKAGYDDRQKAKKRNSRSLQERFGWSISVQLSEWLREKPDDLSQWYLVPCPKGQRCLVVAHAGSTEVYSKDDRCFTTLRTKLPGDASERKSTTILDCIFRQDQQTFHVLDVLMFGNQFLLDCEAEFRYFWLRSKFDENPQLTEPTGPNEKCFSLLERFSLDDVPTTTAILQKYPMWPQNAPPLDGFLFYHKEASYTCGPTPLVCWLFPFMVPAMLGMEVSAEYICPMLYSDPLQYMHDFDEQQALKKQSKKYRLRRQRRRINSTASNMDLDQSVEESSLAAVLNAERQLEEADAQELSFDEDLGEESNP